MRIRFENNPQRSYLGRQLWWFPRPRGYIWRTCQEVFDDNNFRPDFAQAWTTCVSPWGKHWYRSMSSISINNGCYHELSNRFAISKPRKVAPLAKGDLSDAFYIKGSESRRLWSYVPDKCRS